MLCLPAGGWSMSVRVLSLHRNSTSPSRQEMNDTRHNKWIFSTLTFLVFPAARSHQAKTTPSSPNFPVLTLSSQHLYFAEHVSSGDPSDLIKILTALELHVLAWSCFSPHCPWLRQLSSRDGTQHSWFATWDSQALFVSLCFQAMWKTSGERFCHWVIARPLPWGLRRDEQSSREWGSAEFSPFFGCHL